MGGERKGESEKGPPRPTKKKITTKGPIQVEEKSGTVKVPRERGRDKKEGGQRMVKWIEKKGAKEQKKSIDG